MNRTVWLAVLCVVLALPAAAQMQTVELAHEVTLTELRLPQSDAGTIGFKPCEGCEFRTERVSAQTRWMLNGAPVTLADFRAGLAGVTKRDSVYVTVMHHLEEDRITAVSVRLP